MYRASSLHKNTADLATSSASNLTPFSSPDISSIFPTDSASKAKAGSSFFMAWTNIGVDNAAGDTQFTRMPYEARSVAADFIMPTTACLDIE
eukprot:Gb_07848 [translate_table: standard]